MTSAPAPALQYCRRSWCRWCRCIGAAADVHFGKATPATAKPSGGGEAKPTGGGEAKPQEPQQPEPPAATAALPSCFVCKQVREGCSSCGGCKHAGVVKSERPHYCSKECHVEHWKRGGHREACPGNQ